MSWVRWGGPLIAGLILASGCGRDTSFGPGVRFFHVATAGITSDTAADQSVLYVVTLRVTDDKGATVSGAILREYIRIASSGCKHFPLPVGAPLADFVEIAGQYPVYRIEAR